MSYKTHIVKTHKGAIRVPDSIKMFSVLFGYGGSDGIISYSHSEICIGNNGTITFAGKAHFAEGCALRSDGELLIGNRFSANKNTSISCGKRISIGNDAMIGWNCHIRDSDGHSIIADGIVSEPEKDVMIGNHVWLCSESHILKGTIIGDGSVLGWRALAVGEYNEANVLLLGQPAKIKKRNVRWEFEM